MCVFLYVCGHVWVCAWLSVLGCADVSSCTQIYCTIWLPLFCHHEELTHELNRDKEQIYLKQLRYILWTTVKPFLLNPKKNLGRTCLYIHTYIKLYIYVYICIMQKQRNLDGHLTFYLLLSGFRNNQFSCFNFLTSYPMYLFVPHPLTPAPPKPTQMDCRPLGKIDLEQSEGREASKKIGPMNW